ncbi:MAG: response regulator, partial [Betaproteobacteria bacterium]|nr:response regulator [Betaproteobacteria bacterium]
SFWLSCMISIVIIPGYVGILMDKLYLALRYAESESMAKSELLARASHELRTPLGGISNAAELLRNEIPNQRQKRLAETILSLSSHLLADINALLDQSRLSVGKLTLSVDTVDLEQQLEVVRASVEMKAQKKGLAFSATLDPRITDAVLGDQHWLVRVLINLLGNAVKFTEFGSVALQISMLQQHDDAYTIRFSVRDTGMGIAKEFQQRIFDPFVQVPGQSNAHAEGAGLGLAISKQAVELMGGDLRLISEIGMGSTFWFDLRMQRSRKARTEERPVTLDDELLAEDVDRRRILVVDDNQTNRYLLEELLQREGHSVVTAASGEQALDILSGPDSFDLLLLDYNLGAMDGSVLLQTYRFGRHDAAPAYFLTADATVVTGEKLRNTGALGVLTKPVRLRELRAAIRQACEDAGDVAAVPVQGEVAAASAQAPAAAAGSSHLRPVPVVFVDLAVIDRLRQIGTRQVFIKELLDRASEDIEANTERILDALAAGDMQAARDAGHALKGVCMETGAMRLMNMALGVMRTEDAYLLENRGRIAADLRDTSTRTREALHGIVAETMQQAAGF